MKSQREDQGEDTRLSCRKSTPGVNIPPLNGLNPRTLFPALPSSSHTRSTQLLMTRKPRRKNKPQRADLEAQAEDEGMHYNLSRTLRSPFSTKELNS